MDAFRDSGSSGGTTGSTIPDPFLDEVEGLRDCTPGEGAGVGSDGKVTLETEGLGIELLLEWVGMPRDELTGFVGVGSVLNVVSTGADRGAEYEVGVVAAAYATDGPIGGCADGFT